MEEPWGEDLENACRDVVVEFLTHEYPSSFDGAFIVRDVCNEGDFLVSIKRLTEGH